MTLRNILQQSPSLRYQNNIYYQRDLRRHADFEKTYLSLRKKEHRLYSDDVVKLLPDVNENHPLKKEWIIRKSMLQRFLSYLQRNTGGNQITVLEIGCGNGWFGRNLAAMPNFEVLGIDINETELTQAARVFRDQTNLYFGCVDIYTGPLPEGHFDFIVLASAIQYFKEPDKLIHRLFTLLAQRGEIHILDSPLYDEADIPAAQHRSEGYFNNADSKLGKFYYYHSWNSLKEFNVSTLFNPKTLQNRLTRLFVPVSPFPWVKIINHSRPS